MKPTSTGAASASAAKEIEEALAAPFAAEEVKFRPGNVTGNRALALAYVDSRTVQERLDLVLGTVGWQDDYEVREDGAVICRLRCRINGEWVTKTDVGSPSEQPDAGDRLKAAFSDAIKRAAVKFGVGRYLYRLPNQWVDYDPQKRAFARTPTLPAKALPAPAAPAPAPPAVKPSPAPPARPASAAPPSEQPPPPAAAELKPGRRIGPVGAAYLAWLARDRGKALQALCERFAVAELGELTAEQYGVAVRGLQALPSRAPAGGSRDGG